MLQNLPQYQQSFIYVDSSQQENQQQEVFHKVPRINQKNTNFYEDSSSDIDQLRNKSKPKKLSKESIMKTKNSKLCWIKPDNFLLQDNYMQEIQNIIKQNHQKLCKKTALLIPDTDPEILENLQKRKKNYGFFLKALQVDRKYNENLSRKVNKLKNENERKKNILESRKIKKSMEQDEDEMKKYVLDKKNKQQIVVDKIQKHAIKLGLQRVREEYKKVKKQVKQIQEFNDLKTVNLQIKQRNQIQQLREQLQKMKQINRVNKIDQSKALKDMKKNIIKNKDLLLTKAQMAQQHKFII